MPSPTEMFQVTAGFDPYGAMREGQVASTKYDIQQAGLEEQLKDIKAEQAQKAPTGGLAGMAGTTGAGAGTVGGLAQGAKTAFPDWKLVDDQGMPTVAGQINDYTVQAKGEFDQGAKLLKQAKYTTDPKEKTMLIAEGRRLLNNGMKYQKDAGDLAKKTQNDAIYGLATAETKDQWDNIIKGWEKNGLPVPANFPTEFSPENQKKIQAMAPAELQSKINTDLRNRTKEKDMEVERKLNIEKLQAQKRNGFRPLKGEGEGGGSEAPATKRVVQAFTQTSDALENIARLPITTTSPAYGQKNFDNIYKAPLSVLNQKMSDETSQKMQTRMVGVARGLAALESGGAATGLVGLTESIEKGISIPAGAKLEVAFDKLAEMRRIVESSAKAQLNDPKISESRKNLIRDELELVRKAIPYTQADIDRAVKVSQGTFKGKNIPKDAKNLSFTEFMDKYPLDGGSKEFKGSGTKEDPIKLD